MTRPEAIWGEDGWRGWQVQTQDCQFHEYWAKIGTPQYLAYQQQYGEPQLASFKVPYDRA